jgi:hypothetical protein
MLALQHVWPLLSYPMLRCNKISIYTVINCKTRRVEQRCGDLLLLLVCSIPSGGAAPQNRFDLLQLHYCCQKRRCRLHWTCSHLKHHELCVI